MKNPRAVGAAGGVSASYRPVAQKHVAGRGAFTTEGSIAMNDIDESIVTEKGLVIHRQEEIWVFPNEGGGITIKADSLELGEQIISFRAEHVDRVIQAIRDAREDLEVVE